MVEAAMAATAGGLEPSGDGWFVVSARDTCWWRRDGFGAHAPFSAKGRRFPQVGFKLHVLQPGEPNCMYHAEDVQEDFLVVQGECLLLVDGRERRLGAWDFVHCPPWVEHAFVGAGDGPCAIVMVGARPEGRVVYPASDLARRHGAGVERATESPSEAYAPFPPWERARVDDGRLPWAAGRPG
jgi:uncharacterized cupin superfamily protein